MRARPVRSTLSKNAILVTGGAGYIGSHVVRQLGEAGEQIVVLDNLGKGFRQAVTAGELVVGDVGDHALVSRLLARASASIPSCISPRTRSCRNRWRCRSSTTATIPARPAACCRPVSTTACDISFSPPPRRFMECPRAATPSEESPTRPINAYGTSKLMSEWMLRDVAAVNPLRYVALRYFNVAGSDPKGRIGQADPRRDSAHQGRLRGHGRQAHPCVGVRHRLPDPGRHRGARLPARRGSWPRRICGRSIICAPAGRSVTLNVGYGHGYSVREVLAMVESVGGKPLDHSRGSAPRRRSGLPCGAGRAHSR